MVKKAVNNNYLTVEAPQKKLAVNEQNRAYIDRFVSLNYEKLNRKFDSQRNTINSSAFGSTDKFNEMIISLYTDPDLCFTSWEKANGYLTSKFTDKAIRVVMKKPKCDKAECEEDNETINDVIKYE